MKIINLTRTQYRNYSNIHSKRNFGQTIEYSMLNVNSDMKKMFLGLIDEYDNIHAAALILIHNITPNVKEAIAPNGFLIDYADFELVKIFTEELKIFLKNEKVTYLITNPMFKNKVLAKDNHLIQNNESILNNLIKLDYMNIGYVNDFEKYDVIIENYDSINDIYKNFNRNTKRNIKEALNIGIKLQKANINEIDVAYNIFKKKTNKSLSYYRNLATVFNSNDNKMEIFFAKLNPHKYLVNMKKIYEEEKDKNEKIHDTFNSKIGNITESLLNKKLNSDSRLQKYAEELNRAILISQNYTDDIIIGTSIVIRNNHEIYFLIDGYKEEYRHLHSTHILKWAIISKYYQYGYNIFNLGEIFNNYKNDNKYHGQYMYKIGFGGNIIEYPPNLLLVINKPVYNLYSRFRKKK